ncbi:hypothetical protein RB200_14005 [Streptomyces sp. PmtG]
MSRVPEAFPEYVLVATDGQGRVVARAFSVPFALRPEGRGGERGELPDGGWDQVMVWAFADLRYGDEPDTVSAIEVAVDPRCQGRGLSGRMLAAMRDNARAHGFPQVVAPVRPSAEHLEPATPIDGPGGDGLVAVPGALVPVHRVVGRGYAVCVEPDVWVRHAL